MYNSMTKTVQFAIALMIGLEAMFVGLNIYTPKVNAAGPNGKKVPVIVELFTSEGCSDCPPADKVLMELEAKQPVDGAEIIVLSEHVDYWNNLGWTDPYSNASFTKRQEQFAGQFGLNSSYTPQMVVDGSSQFVGCNGREALKSVAQAAQQPHADVRVEGNFSAEYGKNASDIFSITVTDVPKSERGEKIDVWIVVTETGLTSSVKRGENSGRTLTHTAVVRRMQIVGETAEGSATFKKSVTVNYNNKEWNPKNLKFVIFLQGQKSRKIYGSAVSTHS